MLGIRCGVVEIMFSIGQTTYMGKLNTAGAVISGDKQCVWWEWHRHTFHMIQEMIGVFNIGGGLSELKAAGVDDQWLI